MKKNPSEVDAALNPLLGQSTFKAWILKDLESSHALGRKLVQEIDCLKILLLKGPLGAGKTSVVQGIASELKIKEPITSPTFALSQHYQDGTRYLIHLDLYRLEDTDSANEMFLQEEEQAKDLNALLTVEWPERMNLNIPEAWQLKLSYEKHRGRKAQLIPPRT